MVDPQLSQIMKTMDRKTTIPCNGGICSALGSRNVGKKPWINNLVAIQRVLEK
jgi:hypothetical protein